jgi:molecular chaperone HscA
VDGKSIALKLTRQMLNDALQPLMKRAEKVMLETITNAKADKVDIKHVLLVGGSSRLHAFQSTASKVFGAEAIVGGQTSPDLAIAEGAALLAAKLITASGQSLVGEALQAIPAPAIKYTDIMPHSLGISVADRVSAAPHCSVILERNQPIPCTATRTYGSLADDQTVFRICVAQGENQQPIKDCLVVAERELKLPPRKITEPSIEVSMGYDVSGMVNVTVKDLISKKTEDITVDFYNKPATKGAV